SFHFHHLERTELPKDLPGFQQFNGLLKLNILFRRTLATGLHHGSVTLGTHLVARLRESRWQGPLWLLHPAFIVLPFFCELDGSRRLRLHHDVWCNAG